MLDRAELSGNPARAKGGAHLGYPRQVPCTRFLADSSLDYVARRLRFLGFDVETLPGAPLRQLFEAARRDGRTVITPSVRHPRRFARVPAVVVEREDVAAAVRAVAATHETAGPPFSRCALCNHVLETLPASAAAGSVPGEVIAAQEELRHCTGCGKWYWEGSHVDRVRVWFEQVLGPPAG